MRMPQPIPKQNLKNLDLSHALSSPWALHPRHIQGVIDTARLAANPPKAAVDDLGGGLQAKRDGSVGTVAIHGAIWARDNWLTDWLSLPTYQSITRCITELAKDSDVDEIILDVDSPGGVALNTDEAAEAIRAAAKVKPVTAIVSGYCASAAYWLASQATRIVATPLSSVGSVGVITMHADYSQMLEQEGIDVKVYRTGTQKALGQIVDSQDDVEAKLQLELAGILGIFASDVAKGRSMTREEVLTRFALDSGHPDALAGDTVLAGDAVKLGLIDEVATVTAAVSSVTNNVNSHGRNRMDTETKPEINVTDEAVKAVAEVTKSVTAALGVENLDDGTLANLKALAEDGKAYRTSLLDRLHKATIRASGNDEAGQAAADRAKRVWAGAEVSDLTAEVERLEAVEVVPTERKSSVSKTEQDKKPAVKRVGY